MDRVAFGSGAAGRDSEFAAIGKALRGGSGWLLLTLSPRDRRLVNQWAMDHTTTLAGALPILALDMYEHSYHLDYRARQPVMSMPLWRRSIGPMWRGCLPTCRAKGAYDGTGPSHGRPRVRVAGT
jgi:superoxide dismutase